MVTPVHDASEQPTMSLYRESFGEAALSFAAIVGAMGGAVGGAALGAEIGSVFPVVCGTLGTMLGSGLLAGLWCLLERAWPKRFAKSESEAHHDYEHKHTSEVRVIRPAPHAG